MTPTSDNSTPTPLHEAIDAGIDPTVKGGVQESSGPEARENPQGSSFLVPDLRGALEKTVQDPDEPIWFEVP